MFACMKSYVKIVEALLAGGADVNAEADDGETALMVASPEQQPGGRAGAPRQRGQGLCG